MFKKSPKQYLNCNKIKTPATTNVEECTKEEIGVGALIADNNQALKGNWALLTLLPINNRRTPHFKTKLFHITKLYLDV